MRTPRLRDAVLPDLIQQRLIADLQQCRGLLAIPIRFLQSSRNRFRLGSILGIAGKRFQSACGIAASYRIATPALGVHSTAAIRARLQL